MNALGTTSCSVSGENTSCCEHCNKRYCDAHASFHDGAGYDHGIRGESCCDECYKDGVFERLNDY